MKPNVNDDPEKTATYMADRATIRILFALSASRNMTIEHFDITGAYLHEKYQHKNKVFIWQPQRFHGSYKHTATHGELKRDLYGTPGAANTYSTELHAYLKKHRHEQMRSDTSLFRKQKDKDIILVRISMDDLLLIASSPKLINKLYQTLQKSTNSNDWADRPNTLTGQSNMGKTESTSHHPDTSTA